MNDVWMNLFLVGKEVDGAWDAWMTDEDGDGQERMENAIGELRDALDRASKERYTEREAVKES